MNREEAFRPRWPSGVPGYEIWFAVVIDPESRQGLWVRYTTFQAPGHPGEALLWASFFDAANPERHAFNAISRDLAAARIEPERLIMPDGATMTPDGFQGAIRTGPGVLKWELSLTHRFLPIWHGPKLLESSRFVSVQSSVVSPFAGASGEVRLGTRTFRLKNARAVLTHISGRERVPELFWVFAPALDGLPDSGLEAVAVRPARFSPTIVSASMHLGSDFYHTTTMAESLFFHRQKRYPEGRLRFSLGPHKIALEARLQEEQKTGYIYRGPSGDARFVVQSDVSSVAWRIKGPRPAAGRLDDSAAVEFHAHRPLPNVMYLDPFRIEGPI
ncbi:MAG: hypothetical protein H7A21_15680 [Spirochaetales bacterium]|nr:hypothetical protein [Leptospiraceae bacterium]MCP5482877.1 hypothetical protein [Spirochaetales bacterium]MCP5487005.1 hypothetical protein [Spirochaetales bacterium]